MTEHATITEALIAAQAAFGKVRKEAVNPHFKARYADLATVVDAVLPALNENGILLTQPVMRDEIGMVLRTCLRHTSGDELVSEVPLPEPTQWQQWGSALTYARRYSLMSLVGVAPEDDDGNDAAGIQKGPTPRDMRQATPKGEPYGIDADRRAALVRKARAATPPPPSAPGQFTREVETAVELEWTPETAKARAAELIAIFKDHGGVVDKLDEAWSFYSDDIRAMPGPIQEHLNRAYSRIRDDLLNPSGRIEDERQQELDTRTV